jgi:PadR family transcriptional regulator PadR
MTSRSRFSPQTLSVLTALSDHPDEWHHGYEMARATGLKSGSLYPILIRLAERGLLEAEWQDEPTPGRPRRHLYRLTADGFAAAEAALAEAAHGEATARRAAAARRGQQAAGPLRPAVEGS